MPMCIRTSEPSVMHVLSVTLDVLKLSSWSRALAEKNMYFMSVTLKALLTSL